MEQEIFVQEEQVIEQTQKAEKVKRVNAKEFIKLALKDGPKTVDTLSQEYLASGNSRVVDLKACKRSLSVQICALNKAQEIVRVSRGLYQLP